MCRLISTIDYQKTITIFVVINDRTVAETVKLRNAPGYVQRLRGTTALHRTE
jgi:hypothetical protein